MRRTWRKWPMRWRGRAALALPIAVPLLLGVAPLVARSIAALVAPLVTTTVGRWQDAGETDDSGVSGEQPPPPPGARPLLPLARDGVVGAPERPRGAPRLIGGGNAPPQLVCVAWEPGAGDRLERRDVGAPSRVATARERVATPDPVEIMQPVGARDASGRVVLIWTQLVDGGAQLVTTRADRSEAESFATPHALTSGPLPSSNAAIALHAGRLWIAWESEVAASDPSATPRTPPATQRALLLAPLEDDGTLGEVRRIGMGARSERDPVVVSSGSSLWIAWTSCDGNDREIVLRAFDPHAGTFGAPIAVSADPVADDLHPTLAAAPNGDLWIAWDRIAIAHRGTPAPQELRVQPLADAIDLSVRCACVRDGRVLVTRSSHAKVPDGMVAGAPFLSIGGGLPRIVCDGAGRPWIAYRYLHQFQTVNGPVLYGFPLLVQSLGADGWSAPQELAGSAGMPEAAALLATADGVVVACQADQRLDRTFRERRRPAEALVTPLAAMGAHFSMWLGPTSIALARVALPASGSASGATNGVDASPPLVERPTPRPESPPGASSGAPTAAPSAASTSAPSFAVAPGRSSDPYVTGARHFEIARGDQHFSVFFGDLHRHSSISWCSHGAEPGAVDRWVDGRDVHACDFMAVTDHSAVIEPFAWWQLDKLGWLHAAPPFVSLLGYEWSTQSFGHVNVIRAGRMDLPARDDDSYAVLRRQLTPTESVAIPHHSSSGRFPNDFALFDDDAVRLIEVYQARRGSFEFDGSFLQSSKATVSGAFVQDALNQGHHFGFIASTDHGYGASYACVVAERLDRASLFAALRARRTYGATSKGLFIDLRVADGAKGDALMGEEITMVGTPKLRLAARGTAELAEVVLFRNGQQLWSSGRAALPVNRFAPVKLRLRLVPRGRPAIAGAREEQLVLRASAESLAITAVEELRLRGRKEVPRVEVSERTATLTIPASFAAAPEPQELGLDLHLVGDVPITFERAGEPPEIHPLSELIRAPITFELVNGTRVTASVALGDAAIDLGHGLGTHEFHGEWDDPELPAGATWYYARFIQVDGAICWSSPIFVTKR